MTSIVEQPAQHYQTLRRVKVDWPDNLQQATPWQDLANELDARPRVLVIVTRRADARKLAEQMAGDTIHLSALMTPAHRRRVLEDIKRRLSNTEATCRVVATTLVEAGVDFDFPVVYRELGPLDSIAQATGRCNREGRLTDTGGQPSPGRVVVFVSPSATLKELRPCVETTHSLLAAGDCDLSDPAIFTKYFRRLFEGSNLDQKNIQTLRRELDFPKVAEEYRLIDDGWSEVIIVPQEDRARDAISAIRDGDVSRFHTRILQRYAVSVSRDTVRHWEAEGVLQPLFADTSPEERGPRVLEEVYLDSAYSDRFGLRVDQLPTRPAES